MSVNRHAWATGGYVADYANRRLLPVEVLLMARYREALSGRAIEMGCGAGRVLGYLVALGGEVHGIDISPAMVAHCQVAYPTADVRVGDLSDIPATVSGTFSAVLAIDNVLDIFDDAERRRVLSDLRALLEPDGLLFLCSHNLDYGQRSGLDGARGTRRALQLVQKATARPLPQVARGIARLPRQIANRRRLAPLQHRAADHAIINDEAHDYGLLHYYIRRDDQARQLSEQGYELIECLDIDGNVVPPGAHSPVPWLHYIGRSAD